MTTELLPPFPQLQFVSARLTPSSPFLIMKKMEPLLTSVDAVLFDLDGTLVETNIDFPLMKREMLALAVQAGLTSEAVQGLDILAVVETADHFLASQGKTGDSARLRSRAMNILEEIEVHHANLTKEIPFAREMFEELRTRFIRIGIVTRNCRRASEISLAITRLQPDILICREDTKRHKPHPEQLYKALSHLNARPRNSIMVGDHIMDIQSGKAAGMKTIGFLRETRHEGFFDEIAPDLVARDLHEVLDAIIRRDS